MRRVDPPRAGYRNAVWRWHFYAGLFCIPFVLWLALTGTLYLWRPQIEGWLDRPYDRMVAAGPAATPDAQVAAALAAVPGSQLHKYELPRSGGAVRILVSRDGADSRVTLDPHSLAVLRVEAEERRPMRLVFHLHGELMAGAAGSYLVEIAASWAIVMILTGLFLWWPRGRRGPAGVLWPRLTGGGRLFWRDLHASVGLWASLLGLGLIVTGLPWAQAWGGYLGEIRHLTGTEKGPVDWTIGGKAPRDDAMTGAHAGHAGMMAARAPLRPGELGRVIAAARAARVAPPVLILPPTCDGAPWSVASDAADRPLRSDLKVDGASGRPVSRTDFADRHWIDRAIGYGIAAHEGALFGLANQLLGTLAALLLALLAVSGAVMWWRRRPTGSLGAPVATGAAPAGVALVAAVAALGVAMPLFGATLLAVLAAERLLLSRIARTRRWLGLRPADRRRRERYRRRWRDAAS